MIRPTTSPRIPPLALAAAAGLHALVGAAAFIAWQGTPLAEEMRTIEVELAALAAPPPQPEPVAEPEPEPQSQPQATEAPAIDPSIIPEPEPPPPVVFEVPKAPPPPPPPKPAPRPAARPAQAPPSPLPPALSAPSATQPAAAVNDPSYLDRLAAAIERQRDYPMASRRRGDQGRVVLHLVIASSGRLVASEVVTSSGFEPLDRAALGMVRRATLPPLAPGLGAESATFTIPIVFALR